MKNLAWIPIASIPSRVAPHYMHFQRGHIVSSSELLILNPNLSWNTPWNLLKAIQDKYAKIDHDHTRTHAWLVLTEASFQRMTSSHKGETSHTRGDNKALFGWEDRNPSTHSGSRSTAMVESSWGVGNYEGSSRGRLRTICNWRRQRNLTKMTIKISPSWSEEVVRLLV